MVAPENFQKVFLKSKNLRITYRDFPVRTGKNKVDGAGCEHFPDPLEFLLSVIVSKSDIAESPEIERVFGRNQFSHRPKMKAVKG